MSLNPDDEKAGRQKVQKTFDKIYYGEIADLECPYCASSSLRFSYTFVEPDAYGIWISCPLCKGEAHLRLKKRPPGYDEKHVLKEFQERDEQAIASLKAWRRKKSEHNQ